MEGRFNNLVPRAFLLKKGWGPGDEVGDLTDGFLRYKFEGLIFGGAYFRNLRYLLFENTRKKT